MPDVRSNTSTERLNLTDAFIDVVHFDVEMDPNLGGFRFRYALKGESVHRPEREPTVAHPRASPCSFECDAEQFAPEQRHSAWFDGQSGQWLAIWLPASVRVCTGEMRSS